MISKDHLEEQLKRIHFSSRGWGRTEAGELCNILMPDEEIDECVNGFYEEGFAMLVATKDRLLLVDKKPLNYLTVEDMRFDMINEFDYRHRLIGAQVRISAGIKTLHFTSWNQVRLRRLLSFVQYRMTEVKRQSQNQQEAQRSHLEQMNQQLQLFLAMQQYQLYQHHQLSSLPETTKHAMLLSGLSGQATAPTDHLVSPAQLGVAAMRRVVPVISAYTRLPLMAQRRRFQGSMT